MVPLPTRSVASAIHQQSASAFPPSHPLVAEQAPSGVRIMPLGDSITYGVHSSDGGGYRVYLWNMLQQMGFPVTFVGSKQAGPANSPRANEGHSRAMIKYIQAHIVFWLNYFHPDIILLTIGTNDMGSPLDRPLAVERLTNLLTTIATVAPHTSVLVATIPPLCHFEKYVREYNNAIPAIVARLQARGDMISWVDVHAAVPMSELFDCVHPDDAGYRAMAEAWRWPLVETLLLSGVIPLHY